MRDLKESIEWINHVHGMNVLAIIPSIQCDEPGWEPVWVVSGSHSNPADRKIYLVFSTKHISEDECPRVFDCPNWFFELAPKCIDQDWRSDCIEYWK